MVHTIVSRVGSPAALDFWEHRLAAEGVETTRAGDTLRFADFEGLTHELAVRPGVDEPLAAEHPEIPPEHALQGFDAVRAYTADPGAAPRCSRRSCRRSPPATARGSCAASAAAGASSTTRRRSRPVARAPGPSTTSRGAPAPTTTRTG